MYYRTPSGVMRTMFFHFTLLLIVALSLFTYLVNSPLSLIVLIGLVLIGASVLLWRSIYQWSRPTLTEYDGIFYYSNGLFRKRLGSARSLQIQPSVLGPLFAVLKGGDASITIYRSDYRIKGLGL